MKIHFFVIIADEIFIYTKLKHLNKGLAVFIRHSCIFFATSSFQKLGSIHFCFAKICAYKFNERSKKVFYEASCLCIK